MQTLDINTVYIGTGNMVTAQMGPRGDFGTRITGMVSRRHVVIDGVKHVEISIDWGSSRTYLFVPYTSIVKINDDLVVIR